MFPFFRVPAGLPLFCKLCCNPQLEDVMVISMKMSVIWSPCFPLMIAFPSNLKEAVENGFWFACVAHS
jgi:hypothetical protein